MNGFGLPDPDSHLTTVIRGMQSRLDTLPPGLAHRRIFLDTYRRTTLAVADAISAAAFEDPEWVQAWDVAFAELYLSAHDADLSPGFGTVSRPWRLAFDAPADLPPLRHVLLGINAHINYDLPQALLAVISDTDFEDPAVLGRRRRDHERIDAVLASRVAAEGVLLSDGTTRALLDRLLTPVNRLASRRFLGEARQKVWHNTVALQRARTTSEAAYAVRLAELELLSAARITDLRAPGQVLLRLAAGGFGVTLPPPA